ncbi:phospholipase D family protein [Streptomyces sp. NPDC003038]|uniref:phospholipase D family protein n=1 Tax=unclassified Streptomyces TaxID=2593676 RepID=UPI0033ACD09A
MLKPVSCAGGTTKIRVGMYAFTRHQIADRLVELRAAGCQVYVFMNDEDGSIGSTVLGKLKDGRLNAVAGCYQPAPTDTEPNKGFGLHSKYLLIEGTYDNLPNRTLVFTGSQNYTYPSLRGHDETILEIDHARVYQDFENNFDDVLSGLGTKTGVCTAL